MFHLIFKRNNEKTELEIELGPKNSKSSFSTNIVELLLTISSIFTILKYIVFPLF